MKCAFSDYAEPDLDWETEQCREAGIDVIALQLRTAPPAEIAARIGDADLVVVNRTPFPAEVMRGLQNCKLIIRHGDGYDNLDLTAATELGIACANKPGIWSLEVAEQALALALSVLLRIPGQQAAAARPEVGANGWFNFDRAKPQQRVGTLTAGIVGCGKIGSLATKLFAGVFANVLVNDPYVEDDVIHALGGTPASLRDVLERADLVSLHVPMTDETTRMIDSDALTRMKRGAVLINTARGVIVDTAALTNALKSGHLAGAGLDVTDPEPLPEGHVLFSLPNTVVTPHLSWYTEQSVRDIRKSILEDILAMKKGRLPVSIVNPEVLETSQFRMRNWTTS